MELSTPEKFLLLIHHPKKARYVVPEQKRNAGIAGGILLDLAMDEKIRLVDKKVKVLSRTTKISKAHNMALKKIADAPKERKAKCWVSRLAGSNSKYRHALLDDMARKRLVLLEDRRFLFIPYKTSRLLEPSKQAKLASGIREAILVKKEPDSEMAAILGLIEATKLYRIISKDRQEQKVIKARLREMLKDDAILKGVGQAIREMQAAVASSVAATTAATSAATS